MREVPALCRLPFPTVAVCVDSHSHSVDVPISGRASCGETNAMVILLNKKLYDTVNNATCRQAARSVWTLKNVVLAGFLVLLAGCSTTSSDEREIFAYVDEDRLVIENESNREIFYIALGVSVLPFVDWVPLVRPGEGLQPGERDRIPIDDIPNISGDEVIIYWWHDRGRSAEPRHSGIQSMILVIPQWKP
jgi:hypothetical protein